MRKLGIVLASALLVAAPARAAVVLSDLFDGPNNGAGKLDYAGFTNFGLAGEGEQGDGSPFSTRGVNHVRLMLDNILTTVSAVPEPGSWSLVIAGFGIAGILIRRRPTEIAFA